MAKKTDKTILVTGATGKQGGAVFHHLLNAKFPVRVLTRNPGKPEARALVGHGADVIEGDLNDPASLRKALDGVDGVYSVQDWTGGAEAEIQQGTNLIDAANRSGISQFVYSSVASADQNTGIPHFDSKAQVEEHLRNSGLPYTIFRPVFFMENWFGSREQIEAGTLALPLDPETRFQMVAVDDIGRFVAAAFEHPRHWQGRAVEIASDDLTLAQIAGVFSAALGREVRYVQVPWDQFEKQAGHETSVMFRWFQDVGYRVDLDALRQELPNLTTFERWLNTNWRSVS
ncbi:MAG: NmrA/HSCARG family protein [Acidobacteriota bacterium]|nr:NmrA/HSCARG family protein [Acidobacteriota bacterium]